MLLLGGSSWCPAQLACSEKHSKVFLFGLMWVTPALWVDGEARGLMHGLPPLGCKQCPCVLKNIALASTFCEQEGNETEIGLVSASPRRSRGLPSTQEPQGIKTSWVKSPETDAGSPWGNLRSSFNPWANSCCRLSPKNVMAHFPMPVLVSASLIMALQ